MKEQIGYSYPDVNDNVTAAYIAGTELFPGYWEKSNRFINDKIREFIKKSKKRENWRLLDAGCGDGRLIDEFQGYFSSIVAVDADDSRLRNAMDTAKIHGYSEKVTFLHMPLEDFDEPESFDIVLCSHVAQHVSTGAAPVVIKNMCNACRKGGALILVTAHSTEESDFFIKSFVKGSEAEEVRIGETEFNALVMNDRNILPIHFFTYQSMAHMLQTYGMKVIGFYVYHIEGKHPYLTKLLDIDRAVNRIPIVKNKCGRDMMLIAIK